MQRSTAILHLDSIAKTMKKFLPISTAFFGLIVAHGQTNIYHPFPDTNVVWHQGCTYLTGNPPVPVTDWEFLFLAGDTIIGTTTYKKVLSSGYKSYISTCCYFFNQYKCAIRQDTSQRKIYYYGTMSSNTDTLLYDFGNLNLGDTLPPTLIQGLTSNYVSSIDSVLVGTSYRNQYHISISGSTNPQDSNYVQLIEGVGSTFGLFSPLIGPPFEGGCNLICISDSNIALYTVPNFTCDMTVGINENNTSDGFLNIYPNPFSTQTVLQTDNLLHNATLTVDNCFGQTVKQIRNLSGQTITFNRDNLASGLYFVRLTEENKTIAADKLVITDK